MSDETLKKPPVGVDSRLADSEAWYALGTAALQYGETERARDAFVHALEHTSTHLGANRALAELLGQLGDSAGSIAYWRRVVALTGHKDLDPLTALGIALSTGGQHLEAVQILAQVADRRAEVSTAHSDLGMALLAAGRLDEALAAFNRARTLDPQSAQVHCGLGLVYQQQGRWWEAADAYRMTEHLAPQNPVGPMNLGAVLGILGEHEQARAALQRATALAPADQEIREALEQLAVPEAVHDEVTRPALRADQFKASITGDLKTFQLLDVFEFLRIQIKTGSLVISSRRGAATIRVVRGRLDSAAAPGIKRLGEALVARGAITPAQLDLALSRQQEAKDKGKGKGGEGALGALLVREGALDGAQLGAVVLRQIVGALDEVLGWSEGTFAFNEAAEDSPPPISFDLQEVTLELVKMRDETRRPTRPNAT